MKVERRKKATKLAVDKTTNTKQQPAPGTVALACLQREASLLRCSLVHGAGCRQIAALWISKYQWEQVIKRVVLAFFVCSPQLVRLRIGGQDNEDLGDGEVEASWLQHPSLVKESNESRRIQCLHSGCVRPAALSKINHQKAVVGLAGTSTRTSSRALVRKWASTQGYYYVEFKVLGVLARIEDEYGEEELASRTRGLRRATAEQLKASLAREGKWTTVNYNYISQVSKGD